MLCSGISVQKIESSRKSEQQSPAAAEIRHINDNQKKKKYIVVLG